MFFLHSLKIPFYQETVEKATTQWGMTLVKVVAYSLQGWFPGKGDMAVRIEKALLLPAIMGPCLFWLAAAAPGRRCPNRPAPPAGVPAKGPQTFRQSLPQRSGRRPRGPPR